MGFVKEEQYTFATEALRIEIKAAIAREGGVRQASMIWGIPERTMYRVLYESKFISLTWFDQFCQNAETALTIDSVEWSSYGTLAEQGDWISPGKKYARKIGPTGRICVACEKEIMDSRRHVYCSDNCMKWNNNRDSNGKRRKRRVDTAA